MVKPTESLSGTYLLTDFLGKTKATGFIVKS
jgi:hypothetical protein